MKVEMQYLWVRRGWRDEVGTVRFATPPRGCTEEDRLEGSGIGVLVPDQVCEWDDLYHGTGTCATYKARQLATLIKPSCHPNDPGRTRLLASAERYDIEQEGDAWLVFDNHPAGRREIYRGPGPVSIEPHTELPYASGI